MNLISVQEVEKAIANYRAAEGRLAAFFGLKPVKAKANGRVRQRKVAGKKVRAKANLSAMQQHVRRLQGKYMGVIRNLSSVEKAEVKKERAKNGVRAAIKLAKQFAS